MHKQSKALKYSLDVAPKIGLTQTWFSANFCNHAPQATRNETNVSLAISSAVQPHHVYIIVHMNLTGELLSPSVIHLPAKIPGGLLQFHLVDLLTEKQGVPGEESADCFPVFIAYTATPSPVCISAPIWLFPFNVKFSHNCP